MAMAMPAVVHFSHPQHELKLRTKYHLPRSCGLCGEKIAGNGYSCHHRLCGFHLHEECAKLPETLRSFFAHPRHDLTLAAAGGGGGGRRVCDLCREEVPAAGVFLYGCAPCGFVVHPRCSSLSQTASSELHPAHSLTAVMALPGDGVGTCAACGERCGGLWVYRCELCDFGLHIGCLHGARASTTTTAGGGGGGGGASSTLLHGVAEGTAEGASSSLVEYIIDQFSGS